MRVAFFSTSLLVVVLIGLTSAQSSGSAIGSISCYQCNSDSESQKDCEGSDPAKLKKYIKSCPRIVEGTYAGNDANSCRKIMQDVGDEKRGTATVRECAYTGDAPVDGRRRTGNKGIITKTYQCFNEDNNNPCNTSPATLKAVVFVFIPLLLFLFIM